VELTVAAEVFMNNPGYFSMTARERSDAEALILFLREKLLADDPTITGFNIGINCGASAAQTIFHAHIHLIPRRDGDTDDPRGGVRGVIPEWQKY
jgi:ATP adenylyltransferase